MPFNISISVSEVGMPQLIGVFSDLSEVVMELIAETLIEFGESLKDKPEDVVPSKLANSLSVAIDREENSVALLIEFSKEYEYWMFGNSADYKLYRCPRRKYLGGELAPEYRSTDIIKLQWEEYRDIFIAELEYKIASLITGGR